MYLPEIEEILCTLKTKTIMVLASSMNNIVTARNMSVLVEGDKIYCQTDLNMEKIKQIIKNKHVAYCIDNYQILGEAKIIGSWKENNEILEKYKFIHEASYERYKNIKAEVVIETKITSIEIWEYDNNKPYIISIDLINNDYKKLEYKLIN
jgi:uncharacterized pyridoxamine 5'-phosphate oxidase family protein